VSSNISDGEDFQENGDNENMADAITVPQVQPVQPALRFLGVVPGILLLAAVGYAGKLLEQNVGAYAKAHHWTFPNIEYVLWAIVLGLVISNTVGVPRFSGRVSPRTNSG